MTSNASNPVGAQCDKNRILVHQGGKPEKGQVVMNSDQSMSVAIAGSPSPSETSCDQEVASFRISDLDWTSCFYCIVKKILVA